MATRTAASSARPSVRVEPEPVIRAGIAAAIYFGLSLLYFLPAFLPGNHLFGTDYLAGGYFFYEFVSGRLDAGEMPGWVPYVYGGLPLAANPGSTFYPVRLIADYLLPVTWILPFIFVVQFGAAGFGTYLLSREIGCRPWVAFVAGLAFQFTGITVSSVYAGHDGRVIAATFAPLLFFFLHRGIRTGRVAAFVGATATVGFSLLSFQIQSNYYLLLAGALWAIFSLVHLGIARDRSVLIRRVAMGLAAVAFGFGLAAVNFLPFVDYIPESPRGAEGGRGYEYSTSWSMPPAELLAAAVPEHAGILDAYQGDNPFKLHTEYVGALVLLLLVLGFRYAGKNRYWLFFGGLALFGLTIAFGGYTPLYRLYYAVLPGTTMFRAPSISFFVVAFSLVAMASVTLEKLAQARLDRTDDRDLFTWLGAIVGAVVLGAVLAAASAGAEPRDAAMVAGFGRFALFTALVAGALWFWWSDRLKTLGLVIALSLVTVIDLWIVDRNFFETVPPPEQIFAPDDVALFLMNQQGPFRVWVLPVPAGAVYQGGGNYLMLYDIEQAGGEHGNQLQRFNEYAGAGEEVYVDWSNFLEAANFLNAANVRYIVSMVELETPFLREVHRGSALIYENLAALPRAYLVGEAMVTPDSSAALAALASADFDPSTTAIVYGTEPLDLSGSVDGGAQVVEHTPDRVVVRATAGQPSLLVLADNYYKGWQATVNGREADILLTNHTFRGVTLPPGDNEVIFEYRPSDLYTGFYIYLIGMLSLAGFVVWQIVTWRRDRRTPA